MNPLTGYVVRLVLLTLAQFPDSNRAQQTSNLSVQNQGNSPGYSQALPMQPKVNGNFNPELGKEPLRQRRSTVNDGNLYPRQPMTSPMQAHLYRPSVITITIYRNPLLVPSNPSANKQLVSGYPPLIYMKSGPHSDLSVLLSGSGEPAQGSTKSSPTFDKSESASKNQLNTDVSSDQPEDKKILVSGNPSWTANNEVISNTRQPVVGNIVPFPENFSTIADTIIQISVNVPIPYDQSASGNPENKRSRTNNSAFQQLAKNSSLLLRTRTAFQNSDNLVSVSTFPTQDTTTGPPTADLPVQPHKSTYDGVVKDANKPEKSQQIEEAIGRQSTVEQNNTELKPKGNQVEVEKSVTASSELSASSDTCPDPVQNFDLDRYAHHWYISYGTRYLTVPGMDCYGMESQVYLNGTALGTVTFRQTGSKRSTTMKANAQMKWMPRIGQYNVIREGTNLSGIVHIFETDYDSYALLWQCGNDPESKSVIVNTVEKQLPDKVLQRLERRLEYHGLRGPLFPVPRCD